MNFFGKPKVNTYMPGRDRLNGFMRTTNDPTNPCLALKPHRMGRTNLAIEKSSSPPL